MTSRRRIRAVFSRMTAVFSRKSKDEAGSNNVATQSASSRTISNISRMRPLSESVLTLDPSKLSGKSQQVDKPKRSTAAAFKSYYRWFKKGFKSSRSFRIKTAGVAAIFLVTSYLPFYLIWNDSGSYKLSDSLRSLIGTPAASHASKLTYDQKQKAYVFNAEAINSMSGDPIDQLRSKVGGGGDNDELLYGATIPKDASKGADFYDTQLEVSFSMVPQFKTGAGKQDGGHVVFPLRGHREGYLSYTLKGNGVKEDILLSSPTEDELSFSYQLNLPDSLSAKLLEDGSLGVYSADPALFGSISFGSDADKDAVEAARRKGEKPHLAFVIPKPVIYETRDNEVIESQTAAAYFTYSDNILTVHSRQLLKASYPLSIDPSVVVTSTEDFATGNNDGNIAYESGAIRRDQASGGAVGSWGSGTSFTGGRSNLSAFAYNGYLYVGAGADGSYNGLADFQYAPINSNGTIGSWVATSSLNNGRAGHGTAIYNGYVYVVGSDSSADPSVEFARINSDGSLSSWQNTTAFPTGSVGSVKALAHSGYLYVLGGDMGWPNNRSNLVYYAQINANGTLGSWSQTSSFTTGRVGHTAAVYNGYLYVAGGYTNSGNVNDVQYAPINSDGTVGTWAATTSFPTARDSLRAVAYRGYLYLSGGTAGGVSFQYAPINANGTLGDWTTTSMPTSRMSHGFVAYNDYLYTMGDYGANSTSVSYAQVSSLGSVGSFAATTSFPTGRVAHSAVAHNGYLYIGGGINGSSAALSDFRYAPINSDGTIGTWSSTTSLPATRAGHATVAYGDYIYVINGGEASDWGETSTVYYAPINSDGTIGTWATTSSTPYTNTKLEAVAYGGYMYRIGGTDQAGVYYAPINADGTLGTWTATTSLSIGRMNHASVAYNGYLYVLGGWSGSSEISDVSYAPINSNGTIGAWQSINALNIGRYGLDAGIHQGYVYTTGGAPGGGNTIEYARINSDGTVSSWSSASMPSRPDQRTAMYNGYIYLTGNWNSNSVQYAKIRDSGSGITGSYSSTTALPSARWHHRTAVHNGYIYAVGGEDTGGTQMSTVYYAPINSNGSIGSWTTTTSLPFIQSRHGLAIYNNRMYIVGGMNISNSAEVRFADINSDGTLGSWNTATSLPVSRHNTSALAYNGYMYAIGGWVWPDCFNTTYYAPINSNGTLGSWSTTTAIPFSSCDGHKVLQHGDYFYMVGGDDWTNEYNTVYRAEANSNGTLGSWQLISRFSGGLRAYGGVGIYNGNLYVAGGYSGCCYRSSVVEYAPFTPNGYLGDWNRTADLPYGWSEGDMAISNGNMYVVGGKNPNVTAAVNFTSINSITRKSAYSKLIDLEAGRELSSISFNGSAGGSYTLQYKLACTNTFGTGSAIPSARPGVVYPLSEGARYVWIQLIIDDSFSGVYPDLNGSSVTDITLDYGSSQVSPEVRMRLGTHFEGGIKQPMDTGGSGGGGC